MAVEEIHAEMVSSVWKILVAPGNEVAAGDTLVILESMKMEIPVLTERAGTVGEQLPLAHDTLEVIDGRARKIRVPREQRTECGHGNRFRTQEISAVRRSRR